MGSHWKGCPCCGQLALVRMARLGLLQERVFPKFGYYPWECPQCRKKLLIKSRGVSYSRHFVAAAGEPARFIPGHVSQI